MPRESLAEAFAGSRAAGVAEDELRRARPGVLARAGADGAPDRGGAAHVPAEPAAPRDGCSSGSTTRARRAARAPALERALRRGDHGALADRRGALQRPARRRRDPPGALVLRGEPARGGAAAARRATASGCRARALPLGSARGSAATRTATRTPGRQTAEARSRARARSRCALPRRGARARRRARLSARSSACREELVASIARDERELPWVRGETAMQNEREPYRRKLSSIWRRLRQRDGVRRYARPSSRPTSTSSTRSLRGAPRRAHRRRRPRGAAPARRALRLARRQARRARPRDDSRAGDERVTGDPRGGRARPQRGTAPQALDTLILSGTASAADVLAPALARAAGRLSVAPLFETIADLRARARDRRASCSTSRVRARVERAATGSR